MTKRTLRPEFHYRNKPLAFWLVELVCDDPWRQQTANDVIWKRFYFPLFAIEEFPEHEWPEIDVDAWTKEFEVAVLDAIHHEQLQPYGSTSTDFLAGILKGACDMQVHLQRLMGKEFLRIPTVLQERVKNGNLSSALHSAIRHFEEDGVFLFDDMFNRYTFDTDNELPRTVGALARFKGENVARIIAMLDHSNPLERKFALEALGYCGPAAERLWPGIEARLLDMFHAGIKSFEKQIEDDPKKARCDCYYAPLIALARVATSRKTAEELLQFSRYQPPFRNIDAKYGAPEYRDFVLSHWIDAMVEFARFPEIIVERLVEMFDEFEEYDPDRQRNHFRYERVLKATTAYALTDPNAYPFLERLPGLYDHWDKPRFFNADHPALLPLIEALGKRIDEDGYPNNVVLGILGRFGTAAASQLPILYDIKKRLESGSDASLTDAEIVSYAIQRIEADCSIGI